MMENPSVSPEKESAKPAEGVEKPAAKAPPKKEAPAAKPLVDNGDGTIFDPNSNLTWKKTDAWLDMKKFYPWQTHREYVDWVNQNKDKFGGFDNWRIPNKKESLTLFDKTKTKVLMDKNGTGYPLDPIFAPGGASNTWISEFSDEKIIRMDFKIGVDTPYPTQDVWSSMRLVRIEGEPPPPPVGTEPVEEEAAPAEANADTANGKAKPAAKPVAGKTAAKPAVDKPATPKRTFTPEERAAMLKRAKAHAAEVAKKKG